MSKYDLHKHNRQSIRLKGYDYSKPGYYFITICVVNRYCFFGKIVDGQMILNKYGQIAKKEWFRTEKLRDNVCLDEFIVMPNHLHGIIELKGGRDTARRVPTKEEFGQPTKNSIPTIIRSYKSAVTKAINELNAQPGDKVWQRNYYDHIIRNRHELNGIRKYIRNNPKNWENDKLNR
ncbi:MAG: transposase [Bacteroidota bacterium]